MKLEITIPVLNEEETLYQNINKVLSFLENSKNINDYSIVISDNGSTDRTRKIGQILSKENSRVKYLNVGKRGVGRALKASWKNSDADIVGYMDLDLATDLKHLEEVYEIFLRENVDVINGTRLNENSKVSNRKIIREITSRGFNIIARILLRYKITDGMCGFKFFKKDVAKKLIETGIETNGWIFSTEMLAKASWSGAIINEIPVNWEDDRNSKVKIISLSFEYFKHLIKLNKEKKYWTLKNGVKK